MKKAIEVTIQPDGAISIDAVGFKGADCEQATKFLEDAIGVPISVVGVGPGREQFVRPS